MLPSKWENLGLWSTKLIHVCKKLIHVCKKLINTCLQKATTCTGLRAEQIFSVNI